jgi:hypothetical protein
MSDGMQDDSAPTPNVYHEGVDERGRTIRPVKLQLAKIIMGTPAVNEWGYDFSPWDGTDPRNIHGRFVFILSKLEDRDIYPYITMGDLVKLQSLDTDNTLIPTEYLLRRYTGDRYIGTYLHPPSSMSQQHGKINLQQAQTFLPNLMRDGRILMRVFKNPYKNTFWYKFNEGESSNIDIKNHLQPLRACLKISSRFIHSTYPWNISDSGYYQPLRKYIPRNPDAQYRSSQINSRLQSIRKMGATTGVREKIYNLKKIPEGGKSRRKLKTTNRRRNTRTNRRRTNRRTNRRRNTQRNTRINITKRRN